MSYTPATDFLSIWRNSAGTAVSKIEMPGLDFVVAALGRAGIINLSVSSTAPVANQATTAWFQPSNPSYVAEGTLYLWNAAAAAYQVATPQLFLAMLDAAAGQLGQSWYLSAGGPPANTVGNNGDFAFRTDFPGGIYGPKAAGAWPAIPLPGSTYTVDSTAMDQLLGNVPGNVGFRNAGVWQGLPIGAANTVLASEGGYPAWTALSALLDAVLGNGRGGLAYRGVGGWFALAPAAIPGYLLSSQGTGNDLAWVVPGAEFPSGTVMVFRQSSAPPNWTKQTSINDAGLRVVSGTIGTGGSVPFSTVFATTAVGNTTISLTQMPLHSHSYQGPAVFSGVQSGASYPSVGLNSGGSINTGATGGADSHTHSLNLQLQYVDVIIATKN